MSSLSPFNNSVGRRWPRFQKKTGFRKYRRCHLRFISTLVSILRNLLNLHLVDPKVDDFPFSIQSAILCALLKLICYGFVQPCSFGHSRSTRLAGTRHQPLLHAIRNLFVFVEYCHLLELYVKCAVLNRICIAQSFWNTQCGRPRGRQFHLTRSLVALEGWSLVRDRTNRKHCPSHEIWSYKRDGRW